MAKKKNKKVFDERTAKWLAIGSWAGPAYPIAKAILVIIKHFFK